MKSTDNVIPFRIKYISVVASCDSCAATWIAHLKEKDYTKYLSDRKGICCYCGSTAVVYCQKC